MDIIGLDVGFSKTRETSGVARILDGKIHLGRASASASSRYAILGKYPRCKVAAIDAPLLPTMHWNKRPCERLFTLGLFQRRCKPGLSHIEGTGRELRQAGYDTAQQLEVLLSNNDLVTHYPQVSKGKAIVEAFPNAFLGVVVTKNLYDVMPNLKRGSKFDWLYDQWIKMGAFKELAFSVDETGSLFQMCEKCSDHEERAALICLLTAGCVENNKYIAIGNKINGYFFLPSLTIWAEWSRNELLKQIERVEPIDIWLDGKQVSSQEIKNRIA